MFQGLSFPEKYLNDFHSSICFLRDQHLYAVQISADLDNFFKMLEVKNLIKTDQNSKKWTNLFKYDIWKRWKHQDYYFNLCKNILGIQLYSKEYNKKLYHFWGFTKNDVSLVKLIFRLYIPRVIVKIFITYSKKKTLKSW